MLGAQLHLSPELPPYECAGGQETKRQGAAEHQHSHCRDEPTIFSI